MQTLLRLSNKVLWIIWFNCWIVHQLSDPPAAHVCWFVVTTSLSLQELNNYCVEYDVIIRQKGLINWNYVLW